MTTSYPGSLDSLTNPLSTDTLASPDHAAQHANANDAIEAIEAAVGLSGTSFPVSPTTGNKFYRTDRNLSYVYDGTRWVTTQIFRESIGSWSSLMPYTTTGIFGYMPMFSSYDVYLIEAHVSVLVLTTNDGSNYWKIAVEKYNSGDSATEIASINTSTLTPTTRYNQIISIGAVVSPGSFPSLGSRLTKISSPGSLYGAISLAYRLVG